MVCDTRNAHCSLFRIPRNSFQTGRSKMNDLMMSVDLFGWLFILLSVVSWSVGIWMDCKYADRKASYLLYPEAWPLIIGSLLLAFLIFMMTTWKVALMIAGFLAISTGATVLLYSLIEEEAEAKDKEPFHR